ncbi:MAG TPA: M23 family metallopeptidase, partial [Gemmatimonadales bacterium]|nr:M23 family metallopeptidase [Gemmatimonadales bacterium]
MRAAALAGLVASALASLVHASVLLAQSQGVTVMIRTEPAVPVQGAVAWLVVRSPADATDDSLIAVEGEAAGEPLHFAREGDELTALVGVPLEGPDSLQATLRIGRPGRTDTTRIALALARPTVRSERLRVPPSMTTFDSATQARIDGELAQGRAVSIGSHATPRLWTAPFRVPRRSRITSVYGAAREYNGETTSRHLGTDFAGAVGAPVVAAARGVVALVADVYLAGRAVYLDHGAGLVTGYFHLSRIDVSQGDTVRAGQPIGLVGRSGRVTGPHLHWIARYGTITVDPMSLVRLAPAPAP